MKKFPLLTIVLFLFTSLFAQTQTEKEVKDLLAHKWKATHMEEQGGQKTPIPAETGDSFLDIKADGTYIMINSKEQKEDKWSYDHKTKTLTFTDALDPWKFEVIKISDTELVMKMIEEGETMIMYLKRVK